MVLVGAVEAGRAGRSRGVDVHAILNGANPQAEPQAARKADGGVFASGPYAQGCPRAEAIQMVLLVPSVHRGLVAGGLVAHTVATELVSVRRAEVRRAHAGDLGAEPAEAVADAQERAETSGLAKVAGAFLHRTALGKLVGGRRRLEAPEEVDAHVEAAE